MFSEAQGSAELERQILGMLAEEDVEESAVRVQVRTITSPDQLRAWLSRDPKGSLQFTAYQPGASADKRIRVRIQAKFYNATPGAKVPMRRLDILEANTKVEAYSSRGRARGLDAEVSLGLEYPQAPGGYETQGRPSYNRRFDLGTANTTTSVADQMVSGRWLTHPVEDFTEHRTDIVYQITTEVVEQNSVRSPHPTIRSTFVKVDRGLAYLRPEPLRPGDPPPGVPASLRPDLIPALSTTERLDWLPDAQYDPQGLNPVQKELQALLLAHAPGLLSTQWEVSDGATHLVPNQSAAPQELHTVTQRGALLGQVHLLRGSGLVLHPVRSSVLHSKQYHVILRADRVNDYDYVGDVPGMSIGLYWTGYYKRGRKRSETTETGYDVNIGTTVIPPGKTVEARFVPGVKVSQTSAKTSDNATTPVDTMRDTYRQIELAHRYSGKFRSPSSWSARRDRRRRSIRCC